MTDIAERVKRIIAEHLGVDPSSVVPEAKFVDLGSDSLDRIELVMAFEEEFNIEIADTEGIETVGDAMECVEGLV